MRLTVKARMLAAAVLVMAAIIGVRATTYTNVEVHSLAAGSDTYKFTLFTGANGSGTNIGVTTYSGSGVATVTGYYDANCICYEVPLAILNYQPGYGVGDVVSVKVQHFSVNLPHGSESMIEILD